MFNSKRKRKPKATRMGDVNTHLREFILDSQIEGGHDITLLLGCPAISDDVAQREEEESDKRVEEVVHLLPLMYAYSHTLSEGAVKMQKAELSDKEHGIPDEAWDTTQQLMEKIALATVMGSLSQLVDMGLLKTPRKRMR